jgi:hypothetical protein
MNAQATPVWSVAFLACSGLFAAASAQEPAPGEPGPEHEVLAGLVGSWEVGLEGTVAGSATGRHRLDGRFYEIELRVDRGPVRHAIYTFGFDRRHGHYTVIAMDASGTYWVAASGAREGDRIRMEGTDDDPYMRSLGFTKEFVIELHVPADDRVAIETRFIDTRTDARTEMPFLRFDLVRRP